MSGSNVIPWTSTLQLSVIRSLQSQLPFHFMPLPLTYHRAYWLGSRFTIIHYSCVLARMWHLERSWFTFYIGYDHSHCLKMISPRFRVITHGFTTGRDHNLYQFLPCSRLFFPVSCIVVSETPSETSSYPTHSVYYICVALALWECVGISWTPRFAWLDRIIKVTVCTFPYFLLVSTTTTTTTATTAATVNENEKYTV